MGKKSQSLCEDDIIITDDFIVVVDGVTAKTDFTYNGKTPGKLAGDIVRLVIEKLPKESTIAEIINLCNIEIANLYKKIDFTEDIIQKGISAAVIIYSKHYNEIWMIGDCQCMVDGKLYTNPKKSDDICGNMRSLILHINSEESISARDLGREIVLPWIIASTKFANNPNSIYGYSVLNGSPIPEKLIKKIKLDRNIHSVVLASDGYPDLYDSLKMSEDALANALENDPHMYILYHSTKGISANDKSFDDRAYIKFQV